MTQTERSQNSTSQPLGRFRWVILFCSCMCNAFTWGTLYSCGVLYSCWCKDFPTTSKAFISLVGALPVAVGCGLGPIFGIIIRKIGYRKATIIGSLLMSSGWIISSFMNSMMGLLVTFGLLTGFGAGLANFSGATALNDYYIKDRVFGEGVVGSALSLVMFISTEILQKLTEVYTWRGAMLIFGAIHLQLCVVGFFLIRPDQAPTHVLNCCKKKTSAYQVTTAMDTMETIRMVEDCNQNIDKNALVMEIVEAEEKQYQTEPPKRGMKEFMKISWKLWGRPSFMLLIISDSLSWIAYYIPFVHLVERARLLDIDAETSAWINSCNGLGGAVGKIFLGYVFQKIKIHPLYAYAIAQILAGLATMLSPFWSTTEGLFVYACVFGFMSGGYGYLKASVSLMLGRENYGVSFSWNLMVEGIGMALGPTIGGFLYSSTKSYAWTFIFSGGLIFISGAMCAWKNMVEGCEPASNDDCDEKIEFSDDLLELNITSISRVT